MFETTPPQPLPDGFDVSGDLSGDLSGELADLSDPVAQVIAAELASGFIRLCMCRTEPIVARLARFEAVLDKPGVIGLEKRLLAHRLYRDIDRQVFDLLRQCIPLPQAETVWSRIEVLLRERFADVVGTAASFLLSDDRDTAIQMATVATTMAAREVRSAVAGIIAEVHQLDEGESQRGAR